MRGFGFAFLSLIICLPSAGEEAEVSTGAYYYPWYHSDGRHWDEGYEGETKGLEPALGQYSSRSESTIRQHIKWSQSLGIDHWICSWWGPQSWEDVTLHNHVIPQLEGNEAGSGTESAAAPKFCIFYESGGLLGLDPVNGIDFDSPGVTTKFPDHFRYLARTYFAHPQYLKIDGKPVVYLYLSRTFSGDYSLAITRARTAAEAHGFGLFLIGDEVYWGGPDEERIQQFDAITSYNMHGPEEFSGLKDWSIFVERCEGVYQRYRDIASGLSVGFIPGVMPGFDSREASGKHYPIPRSIYPSFSQMAIRQIDPELNVIAITSFNEWHEGTQLEPRANESLPVLP